MPTYIVAADTGLRVRSAPFIPARDEKDNKVDLLAFGQEVSFISKKGDWFKIRYKLINGNIKTGWVFSGYLELKSKFFVKQKPNLKVGVPNLWNDTNTKIIREAIGDEFGGGKHKWDLQCTEYVYYRLKEEGVKIKWPVRSGRDGGKWGKIFKQAGFYTVSTQPTIGSVMCFTDGFKTAIAKKTGHIAYVERVFSDGSFLSAKSMCQTRGSIMKENYRQLYGEISIKGSLWTLHRTGILS